MNIGLIYGMSTYPPSSGGTVHGYQLIRNLRRLGHDISNWYLQSGDNPEVRHYRGRSVIGFVRDIDVLYLRIEWKTAAAALSALRLLKPTGLPVVWEFNGTPRELLTSPDAQQQVEAINRRLRKWARLCDCAVAVTQEVADYVRDDLGIRRVEVVPNGGDPELIAPRSAPPVPGQPLRVAWVGTSRAGWHDLDTLLAVARRMHEERRNVEFLIYGDPKHLPGPLPANVIPKGSVPYAALGPALTQADVGIHLFRNTDGLAPVYGSPLKVFDYMAAGLAIVTNCRGQQSDIAAQWQCGLQSDGSAEDLVQTLLRLEGDRALCRGYGANARRAVEQYFNWQRAAKETEQVLKSLVRQRR